MKIQPLPVIATFLCLLIPGFARAQAAGGAPGAAGNAMELQQITKQLDLTPDQQVKINNILQQLRKDVRETMQGIADAAPEDQRSKMQEVQKTVADARQKVEAELTPEQKAKYYPLSAKMALRRTTDLIAALKDASAKTDISDDQRKQLGAVFDDSSKTLDGFRTDADTVKDSATSTDFAQKMSGFQADFRKQVVDIVGRENARQMLQHAVQMMRQGGGATTAPAAK